MDHLANEDIDEQLKLLEKEPFVQRIREFFALVQEKFRQQPERYGEFKELCRAINT